MYNTSERIKIAKKFEPIRCKYKEKNKIMNKTSKWTVVVGNGKRMARKWRKVGNLKRIEIFKRTIFGVSINKKGEIVDDESVSKKVEESCCVYDLSFQPDIEAGCY